MIRPYLLDPGSPLLGDPCALCKQPFASGDEIVVCPQDGARHHVVCWQANGSRCTMLGCTGAGEVVGPARPIRPQPRRAPRLAAAATRPAGSRSKVRVLPETSLSFAQTCLIIAIAIAIILFAFGCFGLWAIADYIMMEVLGWQYRLPNGGAWLPVSMAHLL